MSRPKSKTTHKLPQAARVMIVKALACQERPCDVRDRLKAEFGIEIDRSSLYNYIPSRNPNMDADLRALFEQVEADFLCEGKRVPFNNRNRRNALRERLFWQHERNPQVACELLKDAARDCGGLFSRKEVVGEARDGGGDDLAEITRNLVNASNEDLARILSATPDEMIDPDVLQFMIDKGYRKARVASNGECQATVDMSNSNDASADK